MTKKKGLGWVRMIIRTGASPRLFSLAQRIAHSIATVDSVVKGGRTSLLPVTIVFSLATMILLSGQGCGGGGSTGGTSTTQTTNSTTGSFTISAVQPSDGSISPAGSQTIPQGGGTRFSASASPGFGLTSWSADSTTLASGTTTLSDQTVLTVSGASLALSNVSGNHSISAVFAQLPSLTVTPNQMVVLVGDSQAFSATLNGSTATVTWTVDGGSIDGHGVFTAPSSPGTYHITAKEQANPAIQGATSITVVPVALAASPWPKYQGTLANSGVGQSAAISPQVAQSAVIGKGSQSSPVIGQDGFVYLGDGSGNIDQIDPSNLSITSTLHVSQSSQSIDSAPLALDDDSVIFGCLDGNVYRVAFGSGTPVLKWTFTTGGGIEYASATTANGLIYIGSQDHKLYAIKASTGLLVNEIDLGDRVYGTPAVDSNSGLLYTTCATGRIVSVDGNVNFRWQYPSGSTPAGLFIDSAVLNPAGTVVFAGSWDSHFYAVNSSGTVYSPISTLPDRISSTAAVFTNGSAFFAATKAYGAGSSGTQQFGTTLDGSGVDSAVVLDRGGTMYVVTTAGNVYAIDPVSGSVLPQWPVSLGGSTLGFSSPAMNASGTLFIFTQDGRLFEIGSTPSAPTKRRSPDAANPRPSPKPVAVKSAKSR